MAKSGCIGAENAFLVPLPPAFNDLSLSNGFTITNVPSVHHSRAIITIHYCMCNLRCGIYSLLLFATHELGAEYRQRSGTTWIQNGGNVQRIKSWTSHWGYRHTDLEIQIFSGIFRYLLSPTKIRTSVTSIIWWDTYMSQCNINTCCSISIIFSISHFVNTPGSAPPTHTFLFFSI